MINFFHNIYFSSVTVSNLLDDIETLDKLAVKMDKYYVNNHLRLGEWLIQNNKINEKLKKKLKGLEKYFHGGGSPTLEFLDRNATTNIFDTVSKLRTCAIQKRRNDVVHVLREVDDDILLTDLEDNFKTEIANLLDRHVAGAANWESFACYFGFNHDERQVL